MIWLHHSGLIAAIGAVLLFALPARATDLHVFSTGAPSVAAKALAERDRGDVVTFTIGQPATLRQKLLAGEKADVVIAPAPVIAALETNGKLRAGSSAELARVGIGVVVRQGAPKPDISTPAAVRKLLLDAHSIAYPDPTTGGGFTGKALAHMMAEMGIAGEIKPKLLLGAAINGGVKSVADGRAEVGLFNISEIVPVKGVTLVGPLPAELQHSITFAAGITTDTTVAGDAAAFVALLADSASADTWTGAGMEPLGGAH